MILPLRSIGRDEVADHYDELDAFYRDVWGEHVHHGLWSAGGESPEEAVRCLVRHVADRVGIGSGDRVVDIGSGYGAAARQIAAERHARVTAVTLSPVQHAYALSIPAVAGNPVYVNADWMENGFADASFDRAIAIESTEHMQDKAAAAAEIRRVLAPGGTFGICAWIAREGARGWEVRHLLEPICREGRLPGMGTETDYRTFLATAGLRVERVEDLSAAVAPTWRHSVLRVARRLATDGRYRGYLLNERSRNREFALTLLRILTAYRSGAMRYLLFVGSVAPSRSDASRATAS